MFNSDLIDDVAPDYSRFIPNQISLSQMKERAQNHYYRQAAGLLGDARLMFVNCAFYNIETTPIALRVRKLNEKLYYLTCFIQAAELYREFRTRLTAIFPEESLTDYSLFDGNFGSKVSTKVIENKI
jgi:hypothetical protein